MVLSKGQANVSAARLVAVWVAIGLGVVLLPLIRATPASAGNGQPPVTLSLTPPTTVAAPGAQFSVLVHLDMPPATSGTEPAHLISFVKLRLRFNAAVLRAVAFDKYPAFSTVEGPLIDNVAGTLALSQSAGPSPTNVIQGSADVARITFEVRAGARARTAIQWVEAQALSTSSNDTATENVVGATTGATVSVGAVPAALAAVDFDADGRSDVSVFRPSTGQWLTANGLNTYFGSSGDIPVPCDYNGDGATDIAVFRPSVGGWYINGQAPTFFGLSGDVPVPGDFDGDGHCEVAVFRPAVGGWYFQNSPTVFFGLSGDIPVPADYDGNGNTDIALFRPSVGGWYRNGAPTTFFGLGGDVPVPGDYDGNGSTDVAIFRPAVGGWYVNGQSPQFLGLSTDVPQPGDYDGTTTTDIAVFRPSTGTWFVGAAPPTFFGSAGDLALPLPSAIRMAVS